MRQEDLSFRFALAKLARVSPVEVAINAGQQVGNADKPTSLWNIPDHAETVNIASKALGRTIPGVAGKVVGGLASGPVGFAANVLAPTPTISSERERLMMKQYADVGRLKQGMEDARVKRLHNEWNPPPSPEHKEIQNAMDKGVAAWQSRKAPGADQAASVAKHMFSPGSSTIKPAQFSSGNAESIAPTRTMASGAVKTSALASAESKLPKGAQTRYLSGLHGSDREQRAKEILNRSKLSSDNPSAYRKFKTDYDKDGKPIKTKPSGWSGKYVSKFGPASNVEDVARATGISHSILQEVYNRGLAAWRTGHRPGASQHAWAQARVYSFVMGGSSMSTDSDLAAKAVAQLRGKGHKISSITDIKNREKLAWRSLEMRPSTNVVKTSGIHNYLLKNTEGGLSIANKGYWLGEKFDKEDKRDKKMKVQKLLNAQKNKQLQKVANAAVSAANALSKPEAFGKALCKVAGVKDNLLAAGMGTVFGAYNTVRHPIRSLATPLAAPYLIATGNSPDTKIVSMGNPTRFLGAGLLAGNIGTVAGIAHLIKKIKKKSQERKEKAHARELSRKEKIRNL